MKIRPRSDSQFLRKPGPGRRRKLGVRKILRQKQILKPGIGQLQGVVAENAVGARVKEKAGLDDISNNGDAVFRVAVPLEVPARQRRHIGQDGYRKAAHASPAGRIVIGDRGCGLLGNKRDG